MRLIALGLCFTLACCARAPVSSPLPTAPFGGGALQPPNASSYKTILSFNNTDGAYPSAGLIAYKGVFYGATPQGGSGRLGTFFRIASSGSEKTLYDFGKVSAGDSGPQFGPLVELDSIFYGTTYDGGEHALGSVFRISPTGEEKVLYSFAGGKDGERPTGGLVAVNGTLYGTTSLGGTGKCASDEGCGTVFKIATSGKETVLYSFKGISTGDGPEGGLAYVGGALYGTAVQGSTPYDSGMVFKISLAGSLKVIYSFKGSPFDDGDGPNGNLTVVKGVLYGTTTSGGSSADGAGTVFRITTSGSEKVLYSFKGGSDGAYPNFTSLAYLNGALYGTTCIGGTHSLGTIFKVTTSGGESVLHSFAGGSDGAIGDRIADAGPAVLNGKLYGVAPSGGKGNYGTVYSVAP
jgi:uncharacterized repeat protein (TIGR03803 family)